MGIVDRTTTPDFVSEFSKEEVERSIPARFERMVAKYPDRIAVKTQNQALTYAELNATANRVARAILTHPGPDTEPVGLWLDKGAPLTAAMLGSLKAGKFFVLLDPSFPKARIGTVLEDSQARLVLTDRHNVSLARELAQGRCRLLEVESIDPGVPTENLHRYISPETLVYIVYTSGSTGRPKGVVQTHRNLLHSIMVRITVTPISVHDRIPQLPSGTANAVTNAFFALLNGATLLPFDVKKEGVARLADWLAEERVTFLPIASPLFRNLCEALTGEQDFPHLRIVRLMSETVRKTDIDLYRKHFSSKCILLNALHSTETGPLRYYVMNHDTQIPGDEVPVGYPVLDKEILLLDDTGREVGFNQVGEIVVRSRYLSPGYWKRPDLTDAKFKPDPEGGNRRLYFTGDLGLMLPDGCLIHKGRRDFRVKIRGYGVEVGEVEKALLEHAAIREAVVVARQNESGDSRLVAYFSPSSQTAPSVTAVRSFLKNTLPDYMIPSAFVALDALPLTPQGKVDRSLLPDPGASNRALDREFVAARTPVEDQLARMWEEVLDVRPIGVHDDFFEMGGHSLLAVRLLAQIEKTFGKRLPPATLFEAPTVETLAAILRQQRRSASWSSLVALQSGGSKPPFFWVHGEKSNAFLPRHLGPDQPLYGLLHQAHGGKRARYTRIENIAAHYVKEVRGVQPNGPYFLGGFCVGGKLAFEMAQQLHRQGQEIALLLMLDPSRPHYGGQSKPESSRSFRISPKMIRDRVFRHVRNLALREPHEKVAYVLEGAKWRLKPQMAKFTEIAKRVACRAYVVTRIGPIPPSLRIPYIDLVHRRAGRRYVPQVYPGRIVVLKTEGRSPDPQSLWGRLAGKGLEVVEVPGIHTEIVFSEPQIMGLAKHVKAWLDRTQANGRGESTAEPTVAESDPAELAGSTGGVVGGEPRRSWVR